MGGVSFQVRSRTIVRLRTSAWSDRAGIHIRKDLTFQRKLCRGENFFEEDFAQCGPDEVIKRIVHFNDLPDGLYEVLITNPKYDRESGLLDDYDFELIPFKP